MVAPAALILLLLLGACTAPLDSLCVATRPIWLSEPAIAALGPHREARLAIAQHNAAWTESCPE